jgi:hypothetical protein
MLTSVGTIDGNEHEDLEEEDEERDVRHWGELDVGSKKGDFPLMS